MTATIKRIVTHGALPALVLIAGGFVCDGLTELGTMPCLSPAALR